MRAIASIGEIVLAASTWMPPFATSSARCEGRRMRILSPSGIAPLNRAVLAFRPILVHCKFVICAPQQPQLDSSFLPSLLPLWQQFPLHLPRAIHRKAAEPSMGQQPAPSSATLLIRRPVRRCAVRQSERVLERCLGRWSAIPTGVILIMTVTRDIMIIIPSAINMDIILLRAAAIPTVNGPPAPISCAAHTRPTTS